MLYVLGNVCYSINVNLNKDEEKLLQEIGEATSASKRKDDALQARG